MTKNENTVIEELRGTVEEILSQLKKIMREGNARRLIVKNRQGKILFQSQLTAGVAGTAFIVAVAPIISAITLFLLFVNDVSVMVERDTETEEEGEKEENSTDPDIIDIQ